MGLASAEEELTREAVGKARLLRESAEAVARELASSQGVADEVEGVKLRRVENELKKTEYFLGSLQSLGGWLTNLFAVPALKRVESLPPPLTAPPVPQLEESDELLREARMARALIESNSKCISAQCDQLHRINSALSSAQRRLSLRGEELRKLK